MSTIKERRMVNSFFKLMKSWNNDSKKDIINKLVSSLDDKSKDKSDFSSCFGAWEDSRSAEEISYEIRNDRVNKNEEMDEL